MLRGTKDGSDLVMRMAQYCLAIGVFHFRFVNRYKGGIIQDVEAFRSLGFVVQWKYIEESLMMNMFLSLLRKDIIKHGWWCWCWKFYN
ncbi:50S ribosomal subunit protein L18 [Candidatus Hodgkinia cicadicola]|uniref:50S ribosomal subunit protein L18 n=1 Tax=Candidatus Hodgkinia cicadicola TaxID=573658 RepID=A0ABX4MGE5_9HYPH|nr:50S ribosomal subunit protein L18 [Candidatus Hodgkinia cicadicola]